MDYSNTIIYKIVCKDITITDCYVGRTTNFTKRNYYHKASCNNLNDNSFYQYKYKFIRENGGWINWNMIEIEKYKAIDRFDAEKKERHWIETLNATLNKKVPTQSDKEYYENNKSIILTKMKDYYESNKDIKLEYRKLYYIQNKEQIRIKKQLFYEQNKEQILTNNKNYRLNQKLQNQQQDGNT